MEERERARPSLGSTDFFPLPDVAGDGMGKIFCFSFLEDECDALEPLRLVVGDGGGDASVAYGEPGMGARGCPRSYARGELDFSFEAERLRVLVLDEELWLGWGEMFDGRVVDCERRLGFCGC